MPTEPSTRTKAPERRRADLLDAGQALFLAKGVAATTLDEVTRRAGVAKGTFYLYFRSKDDLLRALQDRFADDFAAEVMAAVAAAPGWPAKLDAAARSCFAAYVDGHALHDVLFHHAGGAAGAAGDTAEGGEGESGEGGGWRGDAATNQVVVALRELLEAGVAAGAYRVDDPDMTAVLLYSAVHHAFEAAFHRPEGLDADRLVAATQALFRNAAQAAGAGAGAASS